MKRVWSIFLAVAMGLSLVSCGRSSAPMGPAVPSVSGEVPAVVAELGKSKKNNEFAGIYRSEELEEGLFGLELWEDGTGMFTLEQGYELYETAMVSWESDTLELNNGDKGTLTRLGPDSILLRLEDSGLELELFRYETPAEVGNYIMELEEELDGEVFSYTVWCILFEDHTGAFVYEGEPMFFYWGDGYFRDEEDEIFCEYLLNEAGELELYWPADGEIITEVYQPTYDWPDDISGSGEEFEMADLLRSWAMIACWRMDGEVMEYMEVSEGDFAFAEITDLTEDIARGYLRYEVGGVVVDIPEFEAIYQPGAAREDLYNQSWYAEIVGEGTWTDENGVESHITVGPKTTDDCSVRLSLFDTDGLTVLIGGERAEGKEIEIYMSESFG